MDFLENLKAFLVSITAFLRIRPNLDLPRSQSPPLPPTSVVDLELHQPPAPISPPPSANDMTETLQPESIPTINLEPSQLPTQPSPPPSANDPETLQPESLPPPPTSSTFNNYLLQPPSPTNQQQSSQQRSHPPPPTPTTPSDLKQLESILAAQQHLQWINSVLSFCFSYALAISLQYAQTDHQSNQLGSSFVLLSFLVLVTFFLILVALFISPSCTKTSQLLEKVAFLVAAAAFCYTTAIPYPFELKCAVLAVFLLSLLLITISEYLNRNTA
ncbi:hypothetical protein QQP08_026187 [Theobroma cacao]|nr:hypothetical protein QQP08_025328 [Theobroma cacao]WRX33700.1 hypothetical protein QQP08_026187 [Theobroma cacao]